MRVLRARRHPDRSAPVVVVKALPVSKLPELVFTNVCAVVKTSIMGWSASSLGYVLSRQVKVEVLTHTDV